MVCEGQKKLVFNSKKITALQKIELDRNTGIKISSHKMEWSALNENFEMNEYGKFNSYAYLHLLHFKYIEKTGKTIVFAQEFSSYKHSYIDDGYLLEIDSEMKLIQTLNLPKIGRTLFDFSSDGFGLEATRAFDFLYSQELPNKEGTVFCYVANERPNKTEKKKPEYVFGIITYIDGKFNHQKISLKTSESTIVPIKAKRGYFILRETSKKDTELRLEKINY